MGSMVISLCLKTDQENLHKIYFQFEFQQKIQRAPVRTIDEETASFSFSDFF